MRLHISIARAEDVLRNHLSPKNTITSFVRMSFALINAFPPARGAIMRWKRCFWFSSKVSLTPSSSFLNSSIAAMASSFLRTACYSNKHVNYSNKHDSTKTSNNKPDHRLLRRVLHLQTWSNITSPQMVKYTVTFFENGRAFPKIEVKRIN